MKPWTNIATKLALDGGLLQRLADEAGSETQISQTAAQLCQGIDMEVALAGKLMVLRGRLIAMPKRPC